MTRRSFNKKKKTAEYSGRNDRMRQSICTQSTFFFPNFMQMRGWWKRRMESASADASARIKKNPPFDEVRALNGHKQNPPVTSWQQANNAPFISVRRFNATAAGKTKKFIQIGARIFNSPILNHFEIFFFFLYFEALEFNEIFFQFKWIKIKVNCGRQTLRLAMSQTRLFVAAATFWLVPLFSLCFYLDWTARVLTSFAYTWPTRPSKYFDGAIIGRSIFQKKTSKFHFV